MLQFHEKIETRHWQFYAAHFDEKNERKWK